LQLSVNLKLNTASPHKLPITVLLAVKNEALNLPKCLGSLGPAQRVVVLDSNSTDATADIAQEFGVKVVQFSYTGGYPKKRQWAMNHLKIETPWVFLLDADEVVPAELWIEIRDVLSKSSTADAYMVKKGFHFLGKKMKFGGFSFSAVLLLRNGKAKFERLFDDVATGLDMEVHERMIVQGKIGRLNSPLIHDDFKGLEAYIARHNAYSTWEAKVRNQFLTTGRYGEETIHPRLFGNSQERRRWLKALIIGFPFEHWLWFAYHYFFRFGFLEGRPGLIACQFRANYIAQVRAKIYELKLSDKRLI
jgi:glycosyltransferase involved in cell wall biosynthesis